MNPRKNLAPAVAELWGRLEGAGGKHYWRTLEELAGTKTFQELMHREFPEQFAQEPDLLSRRRFLTLMGASLALAGINGCSVRPAPSIAVVPYVRAPEEIIPGRPLFYATAMTLGGTGVGLLVESHQGRPTKIEGNPDHPASLGATDPFHQASVLSLYDPDRSQTVTLLGQTATWDDALTALRAALAKQRSRRGAGLRLLSETVVSPTLARQIDDLLKEFPEAKWHQYEPLARDSAHQGTVQAFGEPVNPYYDFTKADIILSLDNDFLACGPGNLRYTHDFMSRRRVRTTQADAGAARMNRLYMIEPALSCTGAKADHRLAVPAGQIEPIARTLAAALGIESAGATKSDIDAWVRAAAADLGRHRGRAVVLAGDRQPAVVHLLAHALNVRLGNTGQTVIHTNPIAARPVDQSDSLRELAEAMEDGKIEMLIILGGNPVFTAPADYRFRERMQKVPLRVHLSLYQDETSRQCHWHLPEAHYLEAWGDTRAYDGTASIVQPLIEPLYQGRSVHELLNALMGRTQTPGLEIVRDHWRKQMQAQQSTGDFEEWWQTTVHDGVVADSRYSTRSVTLQDGWQKHLQIEPKAEKPALTEGYEIVFQADPTLYDGRFANNGWLQELPKPITRLAWDNAALMSPKTAKALGVTLGSYAHGGEHGGYYQPVVELHLGEGRVRMPAWIVPGHADESITVYLGHGREAAGNIANGVGANVYPLRTSTHPWFSPYLAIEKTRERHLLACTQEHQLMENRALVRSDTLANYRRQPDFAIREEKEHNEREERLIGGTPRGRTPLAMYGPKPNDGRRWGMVIDLTTCTGCNACVIACQAENNIPIVGKEQVARGREMHWLRVDRYNVGPYDAPTEFAFQPVPCMHCENAPCEYVCPVEATLHSADGLNDMVYQRCVGTRFCSNNCPYKVRRFNFLHYADDTTPSLTQQYNPDVTVRSRGVMEKCSYCVQRIRHAEIDSQREGRAIVDGEILTACQAVCPAQAIVFGDMNDPKSVVKQWKDSPLHYSLLAELNTHPRTTYLAALRNPDLTLAGRDDRPDTRREAE